MAAKSSSVDDAAESADLDDLVSALYATGLDAFVDERSATVKRLRAAGRREDASVVAKVRKPTLAAWAIDAVARARPDDIRSLTVLGERLREAQDSMLSGGSPAALRSAMDERRALIRALTDDAVALVATAGGNGEGARDEIGATFEAVSLEPEVAREVAAGQLVKTTRAPVGFDLLGLAPSADAPAASAGSDDAEAAPSPQVDRRRARAKARDARAAAQAARAEVDERRGELERLEAELERVERELARARDALADAEATATAAEDAAANAERAAEE